MAHDGTPSAHGRDARELFVHERFALRAAERPDAVAVRQGEQHISYAELDGRAEELAHRLRGQGVRRGSVVMVHLERSIDLIVSLFATLKAGAAYLPVEPGVPGCRIKAFAEETDCTTVIALPSASHRFDGLGVSVVDPALPPEASSTVQGPAVAGMEGSDSAYVIYTSGSSGAPKGVRVSHASVAYLLREINERYGIGSSDRVLQFAAITFDTSVEQMLVTLLNGATLVLPDRIWAPSEFAGQLLAHQVTVMDLTPSYWRAFLTELALEHVELPVRLTLVGGSAVHAEECRIALRLMPRSRLVNAYGLTETTITSCTMEITPQSLPENGPVPVGTPLPGTVVRVLDEDLRPVPDGTRGEIYIGGPGVAHGYLTPGADHTRFLPDPHAEGDGARLYRTGDLGTLSRGGEVRVLGRADRQIKVRGFRVEPAEIEATLTAHELIADAAVKPYCRRGELEIAAYYVTTPAGGPEFGSRDVRAYLTGRLPAYMVPSALVSLPEMPVTSNGKVDMDALPVPELCSMTAGEPPREALGPRPEDRDFSPLEQAVAGIWRQVLGVQRVRAGDNFFELGGNSLLAAELIAKVRASIGVLITQVRPLIRLLLDDATLRGFATAVEAARAGTLENDAGQVDFAAEAELGVEVRRTPTDPAHWQDPAHILLTGATGFLGVYLLRELLATTKATVHCLVRADDADDAMRRVRSNALHYFRDDLAEHCSSGRVVAVPGDLAEPRLGLTEADFDGLARVVDVIHHPGGLVNFIYPYTHMRAANVEGTREVIRLAARYRNAPVHYTSTMAVISGFGTAGVRYVTEKTPAAHADRLSVGYVESKWVAEALLQNAAEAGLPVAIYRAADISGDRKCGAWNTATEMCAMKKFIVDTGMAPVAELPLDYTPVDVFAAAVAHIAATRLPGGEVYHLTNPGKVNVSVLTDRLRAHGHTIRDVPWDEWLEQVVKTAVEQPGHPMTPFAPLFIDRCSTGEMSVAEMYLETTFPAFGRDNVETALADSGISIPPVDGEMLDRYIRYLTAVDFL
ncbi:amino acid adenylation domain-containing protein [Streptomyces lancefieldiae]|uniref:Amino acid adenylation domain-containing protein n=1 Tax=Streptomyces lancefieldiae TaxID=3075520 RepID=A0ABU3ARC5_9ACTN|nr:amino acid adenylation domain-containing protein [Streptomyces sp. DSM 40712]MDT0612757.1 amino acid adenylation domain-containing protein [Streptomyces sp. DSM 40712]